MLGTDSMDDANRHSESVFGTEVVVESIFYTPADFGQQVFIFIFIKQKNGGMCPSLFFFKFLSGLF